MIKVLTLNKAHSMLPNNKLAYQQAISIHLKVKEKWRRGGNQAFVRSGLRKIGQGDG